MLGDCEELWDALCDSDWVAEPVSEALWLDDGVWLRVCERV